VTVALSASSHEAALIDLVLSGHYGHPADRPDKATR